MKYAMQNMHTINSFIFVYGYIRSFYELKNRTTCVEYTICKFYLKKQIFKCNKLSGIS